MRRNGTVVANKHFDGKLFKNASSKQNLEFFTGIRRFNLPFRGYSIKSVIEFFLSRATKRNSNPRLKGNRKGIIVKGKEFYIPILHTFPTR